MDSEDDFFDRSGRTEDPLNSSTSNARFKQTDLSYYRNPAVTQRRMEMTHPQNEQMNMRVDPKQFEPDFSPPAFNKHSQTAKLKQDILKLNSNLTGKVKSLLQLFSQDPTIVDIIKSKYLNQIREVINSAKNSQNDITKLVNQIPSGSDSSKSIAKNKKLQQINDELAEKT